MRRLEIREVWKGVVGVTIEKHEVVRIRWKGLQRRSSGEEE